MHFSDYIALGDSMSLDLYPALDAGETDVAVALERLPTVGAVAPLGAASLLFRNDDERHPDEAGADLEREFPGIAYRNLAADGATIGDVFGEQLQLLEASDVPTLLTLTIGGTDVLSALGNRPKRAVLERVAHDVGEAYELLVDAVRRLRPASLLLLTTVFDPSDGTGRIPGVWEESGRLSLDVLKQLNERIRLLARGTPGVALAEVYGHFLGHGVTAPEAERWYWRRSLLEPNAAGASEIRRVWRQTLDRAQAAGAPDARG